MIDYTLIQATNNDFDFAYELKKVAYREYVQQTWGWDEAFQVKFHNENFSTLNTKIIKVDDKSIGTVDVREGPSNIFVTGLYLLPEYQSKGIGSSIILDLIKDAEVKGKRLELEVLRVNTKAQRLYKRLGFTLTEGDDTKFFMYR
ncbi:MAG TPA: GNAT family N-acetyltransferase [Segetibacter sp.]